MNLCNRKGKMRRRLNWKGTEGQPEIKVAVGWHRKECEETNISIELKSEFYAVKHSYVSDGISEAENILETHLHNTGQGCHTHFHWGPHHLPGSLQRAKITLGLYKCNYPLTAQESKWHFLYIIEKKGKEIKWSESYWQIWRLENRPHNLRITNALGQNK